MRSIISDILHRGALAMNYQRDDLDYVGDVGLIVTEPQIRIANRICASPRWA